MSNSHTIDSQDYDVAIIGAGIAGSMAGLLCSRAGLRTVLLERHRFPRHKVCGCCVNGRAFQLLKQAGLESGLRQLQPATTSSLAVRYRGRKLNVTMPTSFAVSRRAMDQWLVTEAIASGCQFIDEVTAAVQPIESESDKRFEKTIDSRMVNLPEERTILLRFQHPHAANCTPQTDAERHASRHAILPTKIALDCDGHGHPSTHLLPSFTADPLTGCRIGLRA
ncbi:MAG: FAD-dependent monooxygenase, partial [Planctomycetota bacterium]